MKFRYRILPLRGLAIASQRKQHNLALIITGRLFMRTFFTVGLTGVLALGMTGIAMDQKNAPQSQGPNDARPAIHGPRSINEELDHLTKDLELTPDQRKQAMTTMHENDSHPHDHHDIRRSDAAK